MSLRDVSQHIPMWFTHWLDALGLTVLRRERGANDGTTEYAAVLRSKNLDLDVFLSLDPLDIGNPAIGRSTASDLAAEIALMKSLIGNDLVINHRYGNVLIRFHIPNLKYTR